MDFAEQLRVLQAAQGDPAKLSLAAVDLAYPALSDAERAALKESLEGAAIPHWCDERILAALLGITAQESADRLARLRRLRVVEPFPARGSNAVNVHEAARLALRKAIAADPSDRFRTLSERASALFEDDPTPAGRIERIYHLLCAEPDFGATALEKQDRNWSRTARPEDRSALAAALRELDDNGLIHGRGRVWVLIVTAWARVSRGEVAQLADVAAEILNLARSVADHRAEGEAQALLGDVMQARGKLTESRTAHEEYLAISRRLAERDPNNTAWQQDLGVAYNRLGSALEAQGKLTEARAAFEEAMAISRRLADQDPNNAGWQSDLAVAHNRVGGVLETQNKLTEALAAFEETLAIRRRLAGQDPSNADWKSALGSAHNRVGGVFQTQGKLTEALAAFDEALAISRRLAGQDPSNTRWQSDLAVAHDRVGGALEAQGKRTEALAAFDEARAISRRLAEQDPSNADWQRQMAIACVRVARVRSHSGRHSDALPLYEEANAIAAAFRDDVLASGDWWAKLIEALQSELALCRSEVERIGEAADRDNDSDASG